MDFIGKYPLPFYLAYGDGEAEKSFWTTPTGKEEALLDYEYLQKVHPSCLSRYREKVKEVLDRLDYEGSMIYDEYPDRFGIRNLAKTIGALFDKDTEQDRQPLNTEDLIQVLLCDEIYRRRLETKKKGQLWNLDRNYKAL